MESTHPNNPLNSTHYEVCKGVLQGCANIQELIDCCQAAGLNVNEHVKRVRERKQLAEGIKSQFFADLP